MIPSRLTDPISKPPYLPAAFSAVLGLLVYGVTVGGTFVYDDLRVIVNNPNVTEPHQWSRLWTQGYIPDAVDNLYRPAVTQSYALQWWLGNGRPWPMHAANILLHAGVAAAVAEWMRRLANARTAFIAGTLFALHPVHVEAVANIVGRAETACAIGFIGAMVLLLHRPLTARRAAAIVLLSLLSMLSKEQGFLLPLLVPLLAWATWKLQSPLLLAPDAISPGPVAPLNYSSSKPAPDFEQQNFRWMMAGLLFAAAGIIILREQILGLKFEYDRGFLDWSIQPLVHSHFADRCLMPLVLLGRTTWLLVWPAHLSLDYGLAVITPHVDPRDPYLFLGILTSILWIVMMGWALARRHKILAFLLVGLALTWSMASNVVIIGTIFGERLIYLPSAFFLGIVSMGLAKLSPRQFLIPLTLVLALASVKTFTAAQLWNDKIGLYRQNLAEQPKSIRLRILLADLLDQEGHFDEAESILAPGRSLAGDYDGIWVLTGLVARHRDDLPFAAFAFQRAFDLRPAPGVLGQLRELKQLIAARNLPAATPFPRPASQAVASQPSPGLFSRPSHP